jgi:hypothetical protein
MGLLIMEWPHLHQISSSAPYSQKAYPKFPPLTLETKFHTHMKQQATLCSEYFYCYVFCSRLEGKIFLAEG